MQATQEVIDKSMALFRSLLSDEELSQLEAHKRVDFKGNDGTWFRIYLNSTSLYIMDWEQNSYIGVCIWAEGHVGYPDGLLPAFDQHAARYLAAKFLGTRYILARGTLGIPHLINNDMTKRGGM